MSDYMNNMPPEAWREIMRQHEEQRKMAEVFNRGKTVGADEERAKMASQKLLSPQTPSQQQIANEILRQMHATLQRIEQGLSAMKLKGIPVKGTVKDGKFIKADKAPPHARQARRRKKNTVTGAKPAR